MVRGGPRRQVLLLGLLCCLLAAGVYLNSLGNGFAMDDEPIVADNPDVHGIEALPRAVTGPYWDTGNPASLGMYRPVPLATFAVDWEIGGGDPFPYHLGNVALHVAVTGLVFLLLLALGAGPFPAAAGAALFAVHPVHVEAVANVVGRAELLATLFFLAACLAYVRIPTGWLKAGVIAALYLLSLLSKEMGITLPGALLLLHVARGATLRDAADHARREWRVYLLLALAAVAYFALRWVNIGAVLGGSAPWYWGEPTLTRILTSIRIIPEYLRLMVAPVDLVPDYGPGVIVPERSWMAPMVLLGALTAVIAAVVVFRTWAQDRLVGVGILWFTGTVLPVSGFLFPTGVLVAERTLYLPSVAVALVAAGVLGWLLAHRPEGRRVATVVLAVLVLAGGARTWAQNPVWRDTVSVFRHLMATHPASYRSQWLMSRILQREGRTDEALAHLQLALRILPGHHALRMDYGQVLAREGRFLEAAAQFDTARALHPEMPSAHLHHVEKLLLAGRPADALPFATRAVERFPGSWNAHALLAQALTRTARLEAATQEWRATLRLVPEHERWRPWANLATTETLRGERTAAALALDSARALAPAGTPIPTADRLREYLARPEAPFPVW